MASQFVVSDNGEVTTAAGADGDRLVLPGFINAHSHAFQRALRGRVELRSADRPDDDFWSWREVMYGAANQVGSDDVFALSAWAFLDMLQAGFTAVGEFHYLHHGQQDGDSVDDGLAMSVAVARAAEHVGMGLVLLQTAYARAGFADAAPTPRQRRFVFDDVNAFLDHADRAREALTSPLVGVGLAIHSVRACPPSWMEAVAARARALEVPLHVHACEQRGEVDACRAATGLSPIALLDRCGALSPLTTVVHGTWLDDDDIQLLAERSVTVCITPSTERNLGDGLCRIRDLVSAGVAICVGTDSHARIDVADELRSLEDHERLRLQRRNVLTPVGGRLARALIPAGTSAGRRSLGLAASAATVDVAMPIEGVAGADVGLDAWLVGGSSADVVRVVGENGAVLWDRRDPALGTLPPLRDEIRSRARDVLRRLAGS
jgi:formimidoylglutamate deiminase